MVTVAKLSHSIAIANLHNMTLTGSFLATLGMGFLKALYSFLIKKEVVFVYIENEVVKGFVSFSNNSNGMMKKFLYNCPVCIISLAFKIITKPAIIKRFWETFQAPSKSGQTNNQTNSVLRPSAELLSISVDPNCQASGIGKQLLNALEIYLRNKGISEYKVVAGVELISANRFYMKNGFILIDQCKIHENDLSNIYIKTL